VALVVRVVVFVFVFFVLFVLFVLFLLFICVRPRVAAFLAVARACA
jgi:hypothetical protein